MPRLLLGLLLLAAPLVAFTSETAPQPDDPKVLALTFYADWCGSCKVLDPRLNAASADLAALPVAFVTLDQTNADARRRSAALAKEGGYTEVYRANEGKTGFVLLLHAESKEVLGTLTSADSEATIVRKVRSAVASA